MFYQTQNCTLQEIPLYELSTVLFFLIPVGILMFLYLSMGIALHRAVVPGVNSAGSIHGGNTARRDAGRRQIIRMLGKLEGNDFVINRILIVHNNN